MRDTTTAADRDALPFAMPVTAPSERPEALIVRAAGTNCDAEMARAFAAAGAEANLLHIDRLIADPARLERAKLIGLPGGFSYGDDVASGRLLAARVRTKLLDAINAAVERGAAVIGVCNGFQVLVQAGLLPRWADQAGPVAALVENGSARFIDRWVRVEAPDAGVASECVWTEPLRTARPTDELVLPIAHAEGRFVAPPEALQRLESEGHVALRTVDDVNGSMNRVAGLCDTTGRVLGLMPHPERFLEWNRHPWATRLTPETTAGPTPGLAMFESAVASVRAAAPGPAPIARP